jgi:hypothetical protein
MGWLFAIAAIVLALYSKAFRTLAVGAILVGALVVVEINRSENRKRDAARRLIPLSDVTIDDARLPGLERLTGRVRNGNRSHTLTDVELELTIRDCAASGECEVVGQTDASVHAHAPPGQARDVDDYVFFSPSPRIRGRMEWSYAITGIVGDD